MAIRGTSNFGLIGTDWQQRINWDRLRNYRLNRAREAMDKAGLGALLVMYDENNRYITSTITPGWCRLKPGLRYALLCQGAEPVLFEQGDIGTQINRHCPWLPKENVRYAYSWIKGAVGPAADQQVAKFTKAIQEGRLQPFAIVSFRPETAVRSGLGQGLLSDQEMVVRLMLFI